MEPNPGRASLLSCCKRHRKEASTFHGVDMSHAKHKNSIKFIWGKAWSKVLRGLSGDDFTLVTASTIFSHFQGKVD